MQCQDMMRRPVQFAKIGTSVAVVARKMRDANIGFLPICDPDGKVQGVVTDRDLALRVCAADKSPSSTRVEEVMTRQLVTCRASDELRVAERRMSGQRKSRILVTSDDGRPIGVISLSDIASRLDPLAAQTLRDVARREIVGEQGKRRRP